MQQQGWSFPPTSSGAQDLRPALKIFRAVSGLNFDRARRRFFRACGQMDARNVDSVEAGNVLPEPSGDEAIQAERTDIQLALPPHFNLLLGSQDPRFTVQMIPCPLVGTPLKRPGEPLYI